jgi:hypothetical protein
MYGDITPIFRRYLELERGSSEVIARQGEEAMKKSRLTEEQILSALTQADAGQLFYERSSTPMP